jgi:hypothetical protein
MPARTCSAGITISGLAGQDLAVAICTNQWDMVLWTDPSWRPAPADRGLHCLRIARDQDGTLRHRLGRLGLEDVVIGLNLAVQLKACTTSPVPRP